LQEIRYLHPGLLGSALVLIGVVQTADGNLDILIERVDRGKAGRVWLFSQKTLASIPDAFQELNKSPLERFLPDFMCQCDAEQHQKTVGKSLVRAERIIFKAPP
jgi:hypothetical protein